MLERAEEATTLNRVVRSIHVPFGVAAAVLGLVSVVLGALAKHYDTFVGDEAVNATVRKLGTRYEPIAYTFNELDGFIAIGVIGMVSGGLLWRRQLEAAALVAAVVMLRPVLNMLKPLVDRPRPEGDFAVLDVVGDSSFPSGHTMTAVTVFGLLFIFAGEIFPRRWVLPVRLSAIGGVVLMGMSRMWAGVHWFSDTWGATFWAMALVLAVLAFRPALVALFRREQTAPAPEASRRTTAE
jgi:membrane-associated phospholipid phosphatase